MNSDKNGKYDLKKDLFVLKLKATLNAMKETPFDMFLKGFFETSPCIPPSLAFGKVVCDVLEAIEYAYQKKDDEMLNLVDVLVSELEGMGSSISKAFASLIKKAIRLNEAGIPLAQISKAFEFGHLVDEFEKFKFSLEGKKEPFNSRSFSKHYSQN